MTNTFHLQELTRSLKQVENSKEEATDEFERLRDKKEEMEAQFAALQQLINSVRTFKIQNESLIAYEYTLNK